MDDLLRFLERPGTEVRVYLLSPESDELKNVAEREAKPGQRPRREEHYATAIAQSIDRIRKLANSEDIAGRLRCFLYDRVDPSWKVIAFDAESQAGPVFLGSYGMRNEGGADDTIPWIKLTAPTGFRGSLFHAVHHGVISRIRECSEEVSF